MGLELGEDFAGAGVVGANMMGMSAISSTSRAVLLLRGRDEV